MTFLVEGVEHPGGVAEVGVGQDLCLLQSDWTLLVRELPAVELFAQLYLSQHQLDLLKQQNRQNRPKRVALINGLAFLLQEGPPLLHGAGLDPAVGEKPCSQVNHVLSEHTILICK